jgi:LuxR family maltose regulon positive regulatory protein
MSADEALTLFRAAGLQLEPADVRRMTESAEGWPAGLALAVLALSDHDDATRFVEEFSNGTRHVADYLVHDVLARQSPATREFMVRSSTLDTMTAALCDAVLERSDSAALLEEIMRSNLFLVPLDEAGDAFRYHHLLRAVLRHELATQAPQDISVMHARASVWHEEHGDVERAVDHAIASRDVARASTLITRSWIPMLSRGRAGTLTRWFELLSWPEALADRQLALVRASVAGIRGCGRDEIERWLAIAEDGPDFGPLDNGIMSIRSAAERLSAIYLTRGIADAERSARQALEIEPPGSPWRYQSLLPLGLAHYLSGRLDEARAPLEEARALPGARGLIATATVIAYLALIELAEGSGEHAESLARDAVHLAEELGHGESFGAANPHLALGCVLARGADLHSAVEHLERAVELSRVGDEASYWHAHALLHLARARHRLSDTAAAKAALAQARAELDGLPDTGILADLYHETNDALHHRPRHDGFFGQELSEAEARVLDRLLEGLSVGEVASELWLSPNTVKTHRRGIYRKLGVHSREELVERAAELGLDAPVIGTP